MTLTLFLRSHQVKDVKKACLTYLSNGFEPIFLNTHYWADHNLVTLTSFLRSHNLEGTISPEWLD